MDATNSNCCPLCDSLLVDFPASLHTNYKSWTDNDFDSDHYNCPTCGGFMTHDKLIERKIIAIPDKIASYLFYNKITSNNHKQSYFYITENNQVYGDTTKAYPGVVRVTLTEIAAWYPRTFREKVDKFLLRLSDLTPRDGVRVHITNAELRSMSFVCRTLTERTIDFHPTEVYASQVQFLRNYMIEQKYVEFTENIGTGHVGLQILPAGLERVDQLQHLNPNNKNVFIAMAFEAGTEDLRKAIYGTVTDAGYVPRIMDKIEHNNQIVPEMLHEIRQARFVIAEFSHHNNGAYYEAGYALALGKPVIHVCSKKAFEGKDKKGKLHFDVVQINTIVWEDLTDLKMKLMKRIIATIT